mmetsp:Transcript_35469/g.82297  ORF Transcript_35469/g.82297 Transcript_35469/m.82297 type:complete len:213 (+) Transcript_35469:596-1234(+)
MIKDSTGADTNKMDSTDKLLWKLKARKFINPQEHLNLNRKNTFTELKMLCTELLFTHVESSSGYEVLKNNPDGLGLKRLIKLIVYWFEGRNKKALALYRAKKMTTHFIQPKNMKPNIFYEQFKERVSLVDACGGTFEEPCLAQDELDELGTIPPVTLDTASPNQLKKTKETASEKCWELCSRIIQTRICTRSTGVSWKTHTQMELICIPPHF